MPTTTTWVDPDLFLTHNGVNVFHTYKDDDVEQGQSFCWYTLNCCEDDHAFDVRDLTDEHVPFDDGEVHAAIIRKAIDEGRLDEHMPADPEDNVLPDWRADARADERPRDEEQVAEYLRSRGVPVTGTSAETAKYAAEVKITDRISVSVDRGLTSVITRYPAEDSEGNALYQQICTTLGEVRDAVRSSLAEAP